MASLAQQAAMAEDLGLSGRVQAALVRHALAVAAEAAPSAMDPTGELVRRHRARRAFATELLRDPAAHVSRAQWALAASPSLLAEYEQGGAEVVADEAVEAEVASLWNALAGA